MRQLCSDTMVRNFLQARKVGRDWMFNQEKIDEIIEDKHPAEKITKYIKRKQFIKNFKVGQS